MYRWLARNLGNVSVSRKLGIGFGLVLLLTLLITATGWTGLGRVIDRGDKLGNISTLYGMTKDLRIARLNYEMHHGDQGPAAVNDILKQLDEGLRAAREQLQQPESIAMLDQQLSAVAEYQKAFADMTRATTSREAARAQLGASADNAVARVTEVEKSL
ncbi:methyl-accepting chemotaxis protein, partial [Pseudomonas protegens]